MSTLAPARRQDAASGLSSSGPARARSVYLPLPRRGGVVQHRGLPDMGSVGFTLADRLGAKSFPCSVAGCARTWISLASGKGLKLGGRHPPHPTHPASGLFAPPPRKL